jgi:succinyl-CoA synthetase alpha subunit
VVFTNMPELLELFENDSGTDLVVIIGEVGGVQEEKAAEFIAKHMKKPVVSFIAGLNAPEGKRMGHAGAIIQGGLGTPQSKVKAFQEVNVPVADYPLQVVEMVQGRL